MRRLRWLELVVVLAVIAAGVAWWVGGRAVDAPSEVASPAAVASASPSPAPFDRGPMAFEEVWSRKIGHVHGMAVGDVDGQVGTEILVRDRDRFRVLTPEGKERKPIRAQGSAGRILEIGRGPEGPRILAYDNWGDRVTVYTASGRVAWLVRNDPGVDGAHWGDLNGDGVDEMVVGYNGGAGLHAYDAAGKPLWKYGGDGNFWNQAIVPAFGAQPAAVFSTDAAGRVTRFSPAGAVEAELKPAGSYMAMFTARRVGSDRRVQVVGYSSDMVLLFMQSGSIRAMDAEGAVLWKVPMQQTEEPASWRLPGIACGDVQGDRDEEWILPDRENRLAVLNLAGRRVGTLDLPAPVQTLAFCPRAGGKGLIVVAFEDRLVAYRGK